MLLYGLGSAGTEIKSRGLSMFLMVFYNQVMGLPAAMVGLAASIALIFDALVDPAVGQWSDNTRSRWGRRHPFMYAAALPTAISFLLLWIPPTDLGHWPLFAYMLSCLLAVRLFDTFYELPAQALLPELTEDYHRRTTLFSIRQFFGVGASLLMTVLVYQVIMPEKNGQPGILQPDGYLNYGVVVAAVIFVTVIVSTVATHRFIPWLRRPDVRRLGLRGHGREILQTIGNPGFVILTGFGCFAGLATACKFQLDMYFNLFFWGFNQAQLAGLVTAAIGGSIVAATAAPLLSRRLGKKLACLTVYPAAWIIGMAPIVLRLMGLLPPNGSPLLYGIILVETFVYSAVASQVTVFLGAMMADVVDDAEVRTGRRSEGLLFSANGFFKKLTSAGGPTLAGLLLSLVAFPATARLTGVSPQTLTDLAVAYLVVAGSLYAAGFPFMLFFRISKERHDQNVETLAARTQAAPSPIGAPAE